MNIPDESVEAAARVMASQTDEPPYGESPELDAEYRRDAREILEAAATVKVGAVPEETKSWEYVVTGDPLLTCPTCCASVAWSDQDGHEKWHEARK